MCCASLIIPEIINKRHDTSKLRISELVEELLKIKDSVGVDNLCIYTTGSYGRLEASENSDLDVFFIDSSNASVPSISNINKILLDGEIIRLCRNKKFPEFSGDGKYLVTHFIGDIITNIGNSSDDYNNYFTARLLFLLESKCLLNFEAYNSVRDRIVEAYFRDYHQHELDFAPLFLVNDIIRFWRTLCLNYENVRGWRVEDKIKKRKSYLMNLKLKYSRLLTCYSLICYIVASEKTLGPSDIKNAVSMTPIERLLHLAKGGSDVSRQLNDLLSNYAWFLEVTGKPKLEVYDWIGDEKNRNDAFARARIFTDGMYKLIKSVSYGEEKLKYLVI